MFVENIPAPRRILFVCSGNICRSPAAEAIARLWLDRHALGQVATASCGSLRITGEPAAALTVEALARRGVDLRGHRSRPLSHFLLREADLVVGMEPAHREAALWELGGDTDLVPHGVHVVTEYHPEDRFRDDGGIYDFVEAARDEYLEGIAELERCVHRMLEEFYPEARETRPDA
ncbi:MAG: hypothetical protein Q8O14_02100 [bacterium]|nr:hypothetical protein [bacterium]